MLCIIKADHYHQSDFSCHAIFISNSAVVTEWSWGWGGGCNGINGLVCQTFSWRRQGSRRLIKDKRMCVLVEDVCGVSGMKRFLFLSLNPHRFNVFPPSKGLHVPVLPALLLA